MKAFLSMVIHLNTGDCVHSLMPKGIIEELYDVAVIFNCRCPMAIKKIIFGGKNND